MKKTAISIILLTLAACASNSDFDSLKRDTDNLRRESSEAKKEIDSLKEFSLRVVREDSFNAMRDGQIELNSRVSDLAGGLQELRGRFDESKYYQEKIFKETAAERDLLRAQIAGAELQLKALKDRFAVLEDAIKAKEAAKAQQDAGTTAPEKPEEGAEQAKPDDQNGDNTVERSGNGDDKVKAYDAAYQAVKDKKYKEAREKLSSFIKDSPGHRLAGNAQFWIAETYYAEKDFESAILAYETLLKKYPDSEKTSGAMLKQGYAFIEIGDSKTGKAILEKLLQKYHDSKEAGLAKKKLAEIEKKPGRKK
ncbi:MAG: tol-pal system protein YbgF [Nitrospirae bacterium]|nr:tol-pal system protein YbgF [Nitrospirota bacterium]